MHTQIEFLKALSEHYSWCRVAPGIQVSWLADKQEYYVGVHVFPSDIKSRQVIAKANHEDCETAVQMAHDAWLKIVKQTKEQGIREPGQAKNST